MSSLEQIKEAIRTGKYQDLITPKAKRWLSSETGKAWLSKQSVVKSIKKGWVVKSTQVVPFPYVLISTKGSMFSKEYKSAIIHIKDVIKQYNQIKKAATKTTAKKTATKKTVKKVSLSKYGQKKQSGLVKDIGRDQKRQAKPAGYRRSASGNVYYENRVNRSDQSPHMV